MEVVTFNFITPSGYKNHAQHETKKMITKSMLRQQLWADNDEFDYRVKNSQRVLELNVQYENHPYAEEFTKQCNVMFIYGTYVLGGRQIQNFLWVIYGIYFRKIIYQRTQAIFAGK